MRLIPMSMYHTILLLILYETVSISTVPVIVKRPQI